MTDARGPDGGAAMRALQAARPEVEALRRGPGPSDDSRGLIMRVANAVDRSLRKMLRDDETADLSLRLKALAPDELRTDAVLAELRRNERLPMDLAAGIHELLEARRRLERGGEPNDADGGRAVRVADLLAREIQRMGVPAAPAPVSPVRPPDDSLDDVPEVYQRRARRAEVPPIAWISAALVIALLVIAGVWYVGQRGPSQIDQGIALFQSGQYAEAAQYFFRHAQENPDELEPHLYLARIHRRMERPELAADALREAERIAPQDPAVHRELGFLLLETGQAEVAVRRFEYAIELDEESSEAWVGLVRALRASGREAEVNRAISDAPAEVRALLSRPDSL
jgi:tetratricopeptide (TPR) repeat protein